MGKVYSKGGYFGNKGTLPDIRFDCGMKSLNVSQLDLPGRKYFQNIIIF